MSPPPPELPGRAAAVTTTDWAAVPPGPMQVSVKVVVAVTITASVPEPVDGLPLQAPPLAVHEVASLVVQLKVVSPPAVTLVGEAVKVTVGAVYTICTAYIPYCCFAAGVAMKVN